MPIGCYVAYAVQGCVGAGCIGYVFYNSFIIGVALIPIIFLYILVRRKGYIRRKRQQLLMQFKAGMEAVSVALSAGYSVENAFSEAHKEMEYLYGSKSEISELFLQINNQLALNKNIEDILMRFADEAELEDVMSFAEVFKFAKRTGGDIVEIIKHTTVTIGDKAEVAREISVLISDKQMEQLIMDVVPIAIIIYLRFTSPELLMGLYQGITGRLIMTGCLVVYVAAVGIALKITDIKV